MAINTQASTAVLLDAGLVRLTELGAEMVYLKANFQPTTQVALSIIDLRQKLEAIGQTTDAAELLVLKQYVQETYGLLAVYTDPLLRPKLPVLSAGGNQLVEVVLNVNGYDVVVNGFLVRLGYALVPNTAPVYNTTLLPGGTVTSVAYNSSFATEFAFDGPVPALPATARRLKLFVGTVQVGTIDFPSTLDGQGFSVLYQGTLYYGTFQLTVNNELVL